MIPYLIHSSLLLTGLYFFYWLLLRKESYFHINRWVLLGSIAISLLLPLITIPSDWSIWKSETPGWQQQINEQLVAFDDNQKVINKGATIDQTQDNEALKKATPLSNQTIQKNKPISKFSFSKIISIVYFSGVVVFFLSFLVQLFLLIAKTQVLHNVKDGAFKIVELNKDEAPYSFWTSIFINPAKYDHETYEQIIAHEKIHIQQAHYVDKLIAELLVIAFWFNPVAWFFRRSLGNNLEYLTDQTMLEEGALKEQYQMSLLKVSVPQYALNLSTNYNQSFLKNRIAMMNAKKSSARSAWKYFAMLPLLGFAIISLNAVKGPTYLETTKPTVINEKELPNEATQIPDSFCQEESAKDDDLIKRFPNLALRAGPEQNFQYWQWPKAQAALIQQLTADGFITQSSKITMVTCDDNIYVNGKKIADPGAYQSLMRKYNVVIEDGWRFKKQGEKIMITNSVHDIELLQKEVTNKLIADGLINKANGKNVLKIYGDDIYINDEAIAVTKIAGYHQLLDKYLITPAPGKVILMNSKNTDFGVGYRGDNSFAGTWLLGD